MKRFRLWLIWAAVFLPVQIVLSQAAWAQTTFAQTAVAQAKREVVVAAAANFSEAFRALGPKFEAATGIHPVFSFASTAQLANQVERGAPCDVFAAADAEHAQKLERGGLLQSRVVFARGVLALWLPHEDGNLKSLTEAKFRVIAIAKPELAPYGAAAVDALKQTGIWEQVKPKVVYAENVSMAKQYGESGNADAVLTAYSLVIHLGWQVGDAGQVGHEKGMVIRIDPKLYGRLDHELGVVSGSKHGIEAQAFVEFLMHSVGQGVLREFGYRSPFVR